MTRRYLRVGGAGPFIYDDEDTITDDEYGYADGEPYKAFQTDGSMAVANLNLDELTISGLTALRLIATDALKKVVSVASLTAWIAGTADQLTVTDDGDGTVTLSIPSSFLTGNILGTLNQVIVTDNGDGSVTLSLPQDLDTNADVTFDTLVLDQLKIILDNGKILLGAGDDASIYYDGTDFWLKTDEVAASDLKIACGTNKTLELQQPVYEDLQVSISNIKLPPAQEPSDVLYDCGVVGGVTFPFLGFALNEYIYFDVQTSHSMKLNTVLENHIHFILPNTTNIGDKFKFQLDVIAAGINGQWTVPTGSPFAGEHTVAADDDTYHRYLDIADIPASNTTVSTIYKCKLTRVAATSDEYGSEVYITFTDCHYQKNTMGSRQENSK